MPRLAPRPHLSLWYIAPQSPNASSWNRTSVSIRRWRLSSIYRSVKCRYSPGWSHHFSFRRCRAVSINETSTLGFCWRGSLRVGDSLLLKRKHVTPKTNPNRSLEKARVWNRTRLRVRNIRLSASYFLLAPSERCVSHTPPWQVPVFPGCQTILILGRLGSVGLLHHSFAVAARAGQSPARERHYSHWL